MIRRICTVLAVLSVFHFAIPGSEPLLPGTHLFGQGAAPAPAAAEDISGYILPHRVISARANLGMEAAMLKMLNHSRMISGRAPLGRDIVLQGVARRYGVEMFASGYLSHRSLDGRMPWDRMAIEGLRPQYAGENLAYAMDVLTAHTLLMNSPEHRYNILFSDYHRVGIGVLDGGSQGIIVVEDFTN